MILSENYVKTPGKMYKVRVQCVSTRRLTAMEWLIVNCAAKFQGNSQIGQKKLKYVFEEIFQLTSSEILIKPCIESLINEQAITLNANGNFDYSELCFSQIHLTDKGRRMAEDGLFPGAAKELPLDIYYDPLTEKINQFVGGGENIQDAIEFGTETDYNTDFPEEKIIEALHKGLVGRGKFVASKLRIEEIDCVASFDWESNSKLTVSVDDGFHITIQPPIKEEGVKKLIANLLFSKEITSAKLSLLQSFENVEPRRLLGAGKKLKDSFLEIGKNGNVIGMQEDIYQIYKRNSSVYKYRTIVLWGADTFKVGRENESIYVYIPEEFDVPGCVAINEKNESVSICKCKFIYEEQEVIAPVALEDKRLRVGEQSLKKWLKKQIDTNYVKNVQYISLLTLPLFEASNLFKEELFDGLWRDATIEKFLLELQEISSLCEAMGTEMFKFDALGEKIWKFFSSHETSYILEKLRQLMQLNCISSGSNAQKYILKNILNRVDPPKTYNDLFVLLQSVGIKTHEDALMYDEIVNPLYTKELIIDTLNVILTDKFTKLPELFEFDSFFNEYVKAIKELEFLIADFKMFKRMNVDEVERSIEKCADIALLQSYIAEIISKNAELLNKGINVYAVLKNIDSDKAECFFNNIELIKQKVASMMQIETKINSAGEISGSKKKIYIIDTCALMHHPELLLYFTEDEYVRIPTKVIDELGKIKDMRSAKFDPELSRTAARLAFDIERKYLKLFNADKKMRLMIENADLELLPVELDKRVPDNQILSVAMKYIGWDTVIISDDGVFRLTSIAQNINAITSDEFIDEHAIYKKTLDKWIEKFCKAGGVINLQPTVPLAKPKEEIYVEFVKNDTTDAVSLLEQNQFSDAAIDSLSVRELKRFLSADLTEPVFTLLQNNGVKTIGQFKKLSQSSIASFKAKGKQAILKNNIVRAIKKFREMQGNTSVEENDHIEELANKKDDSKDILDEVNVLETSHENEETKIEEIKDSHDNSCAQIESSNEAKGNLIGVVDVESFMSCIEYGDFTGANKVFQSLTDGLNPTKKAYFMQKLFLESDDRYYTDFIRFLFSIYPNWMVRLVTGNLEQENIDRIKASVDFEFIVNEIIDSENLEKFGNLVADWNMFDELVNWSTNLSKEELLRKINTPASIQQIFKECITKEEDIIEYICKHENLSDEAITEECIRHIVKNNQYSEQFYVILCKHLQSKNNEDKLKPLSLKNVVELAIGIPVENEEKLIYLLEQCTSYSYKVEKNKHYAQVEPSKKTLEPIKRLVEANLPIHRIIYVYMNTRLRSEINVDRLIQEMILKGYNSSEILKELQEYWILGTIKYIQEDGRVRVAPTSVSNSRLMVFNSTKVHINGQNGWIDPSEEIDIYFKIEDFLDGGLFFINSPCVSIK